MSAILSADDLNDFISPGVACIKPIETLPEATPSESANELEVILDGQGLAAKASNDAAPAQISLTDCLACSGCVTSAEAVLVSLQSHAEVLSTLDAAPALRIIGPDTHGAFAVEGLEDEDAKLFVASVSPQVRANLAATCGPHVSAAEAGSMLENLLSGPDGLSMGGRWNNQFSWVVDTNASRDATLVLSADEILSPDRGEMPASPQKPTLSSSCPGWVCYAEKTHPHVLPHLSRVKSPQALTGTILKSTLGRQLGLHPSRIWHLAIMPCFDKKLEASRGELTDTAWAGASSQDKGVRDVDCVITSKEILMLAESRGVDFLNIPSTFYSLHGMIPFPDARIGDFLFSQRQGTNQSSEVGSSGGLLFHVLRRKMSQIPGAQINVQRGRNADVVEYSICVDGEAVFTAGRYYGFRNIQNLVRRLKPSRPSRMPGGKAFGSARRPGAKATTLEHSYAEVMACPGGCTNGGGQISIDDSIVIDRKGLTAQPGPKEKKDWLAEIDEAYFSSDESTRMASETNGSHGDVIDGISRSYIYSVLSHWSESTGVSIDRLAFTTFREVVSDVGKNKPTDTEAAIQLAGKIGGGW